MSMPGDITFLSHTSYFGSNLTAYVNNGTISESRVDDMGTDYFSSFFDKIFHINIENSATRILASWYLLGQDSSYPPTNFDATHPDSEETNLHVDVQDNHYKLVRTLGAASTVLLKNERGVLPLGKKDRSIVIVGSGAGPGKAGPNQFSSGVRFFPLLIKVEDIG